MRYSARKLRIMKPAPASSTSVSAISTTMSALVQRRARGPPVPPRPPPPSFITSLRSVFDTCSAGARPNSTPVARQMAPRKTKTIGSIVNVIQYGLPMSVVTCASNHLMPRIASPSPSTPPIDESSTLSTSSCRMIRQRLAPSDTRTAISRDRRVARPSRRLATLAQAISSTKTTAPISERKMSRSWGPAIHSLKVMTFGL